MAKLKAANSGSQFTYSRIEDDVYEARVARFVMVGFQKQKPYQGKPKDDALVAKVGFELIGETVTVTDKDGNSEEKPAMVFYDINIPAAGVSRGKAFDLINAVVGDEATYGDSLDYQKLVGLPVMVEVGHYLNTNTNKEVTCVNGVSKMNKKAKDRLEELSLDPVFFCPYTPTDEMKSAYASLGNFIQDKIKEASDADEMPCIQDQWPTSADAEAEDDDEF